MIIAWDNKWDGATLTVGSELATLPGTNTKTAHLAQKWYTAVGIKSSNIVADLGSSLACSMLAVLGTNLTSAASSRLRGSNADATGQTPIVFDSGPIANVKSSYGAIYKPFKGKYATVSGETPSFAVDTTSGFIAAYGAGQITFTRAGATATRTNPSGLTETVPADTPRLDYDPVTLACKGWLIEPARTNLVPYGGLDTWAAGLPTGWTKSVNATLTQVTGCSVGGSAARFTASVGGNTGNNRLTSSAGIIAINNTYTISARVRRVTGVGALSVANDNTGTNNIYTALTGDWAWVSWTFTSSGTAASSFAFFPQTADDTFDIDNVNLENAPFATSWIPTDAVSVARNADAAAVADISGFYNAPQGTLHAEFISHPMGSASVEQSPCALDDGTSNNAMIMRWLQANAECDAIVFNGGVQSLDSGFIRSAGATIRSALAYKTNASAHSVDGLTVQTAAGTIPAVTTLRLGAGGGVATRILGGHLRRISYFQKRLTDAQLQSLTTASGQTLTDFEPSARYWRLELTDNSVASNLQIGRVFLGPSWTISQALLYGWSVMEVDPSNVTKSRGGQSFPDAVAKYRMLDFTLDFLSEATMFDNAFVMARAQGTVKDVLAIPLESSSYISEQSVWGRIISQEPLIHRLSQIFRQKFTVEERL